MSLKRAGWLAAAALLLTQPLWAGTIYVPFAADIQIDDVRYETQIWVSNKGIENRRLTSYFIPAGADGTDRPTDVTYPSITVGGLTTVLVNDLSPTDTVGLFEISGAPQLVVSSRIIPVGQGGQGASLPVISSENLLAAGDSVHLQGLARDSDLVTDFGLVNLSQNQASCTVENFAAGGASLANSAVVTVPKVSMLRYADVLGLLGQQQISGVRTTVSCDQTFYTFAIVFNRASHEINVLSPAEGLTSTLTRPGDTPPPPPPSSCGATGVVCFEEPGIFHTPTNGNKVRRIEFPVPSGRYSKLHLRMEVRHGGWKSPSTGLHNIFWLAKDRNFNLYGYVNLRGPNRDTVLIRHGVRQEATAKAKIELAFGAVPGQTYVFDYTYDPSQRFLTLLIKDLQGNILFTANGVPNVNAVNVDPGEKFVMDFGFPDDNPNEPSTIGWNYQNLTLEFIP